MHTGGNSGARCRFQGPWGTSSLINLSGNRQALAYKSSSTAEGLSPLKESDARIRSRDPASCFILVLIVKGQSPSRLLLFFFSDSTLLRHESRSRLENRCEIPVMCSWDFWCCTCRRFWWRDLWLDLWVLTNFRSVYNIVLREKYCIPDTRGSIAAGS